MSSWVPLEGHIGMVLLYNPDLLVLCCSPCQCLLAVIVMLLSLLYFYLCYDITITDISKITIISTFPSISHVSIFINSSLGKVR
jgi:hypothetical protein